MSESKFSWAITAGGAIAGVTVWLVYFTLELFSIRILPHLQGAPRPMLPWTSTVVFLAIYILIGVVLGAAAAWMLHAAGISGPDSDSLYRLAAVATMLLALIADQATREGRISLFAVVIPTALLIGLVGVLAGAWRARGTPQVLLGPWPVSLAIVGAAWLVKVHFHDRNSWHKVVPVLAWLGSVFLVAALVHAILRRTGGGGLSRRAHLAVAVVAALSVGVCSNLLQPAPLRTSPVAPPGEGVRRPPVLLIVLDTVRADHLSLYGYSRDTTPRLREFAKGATLYRNATAVGDMTLQTHASMFTGVFASAHGAHFTPSDPFGSPLDQRWLTLTEILHAAGFQTFGVVANYAYVSAKFGFSQGFEYYDVQAGVSFLDLDTMFTFRERIRRITARVAGVDPDTGRYRDAGVITGEAIRLLSEEARPGRPWFLFLNLMDAHTPYSAPPPFHRMFPGWEWPMSALEYRSLIERTTDREVVITARQREFAKSQYDGAIAYLDSKLGDLLDQLRRRNLYDDSLIVITADHGEALGEKGMLAHGVSVYQNQVHVPLLIKMPRQTTGAIVEERVSQVDIMPTILAAAGLAAPSGLHGIDLARIRDAGPRWIYSESFLRHEGLRFKRIERAAFRGPRKLIVSDRGKREMFDVSTDPLEDRNLYRPGDAASQQMLDHLTSWIKLVPKEPTSPSTLDRETRERLRSLGYIQ